MKSFFFLVCIYLSIAVSGQEISEAKSLDIFKTDQAPIIDGALDEEMWSELPAAKDFWQYFPTDSLQAQGQTEIYISADDEQLYVGIKCYGAGDDWIVSSLRRDYRAGGSDNITLIFDTFNDKTNAVFFGINPEGVIREGLIANGGNNRSDFSESWDNKWRGEAKIYDGYYTAELAIPFSTLRFDPSVTEWGFSAYRFDTQDNEISVWNQRPRNQGLFNLAFSAPLRWVEPIGGGKKSNISVIPFVSAGVNRDFEEGTPAVNTAEIGGDVKVAVTPGLNLDLTINPDFSQVEVDQQITNLSRFEIFFPERRQFFLENADLFGGFGFRNINPFFSRRIGVGEDVNTGLTVQNRILGGVRLSGKVNKDTRVGFLNMLTAPSEEQGLPQINYSVGVVQQKIWDRSNIGFILINKQSMADNLEELGQESSNRVGGIDFNYASPDNTWSGKTFAHVAFTPDESAKLAHGTELSFNKRKIGINWSHEYVQDDYNAEVGFIQRTNYFNIAPQIEFKFYPESGNINQWNIQAESEVIWRPGFGRSDHEFSLGANGQLADNSRFFGRVSHNFVHLFGSFDPTGTESDELLAGTDYNYVDVAGFFSTDNRKDVQASFRAVAGQYFNGYRAGIGGSVRYRYQPKGQVELTYSINHFDLPHLEKTRQTLLIGPRVDYTFSRSLFATAFVQYNTQSKNTNINTRIQWRFAPASDFFLVYTDNYFTGTLEDPSDRFGFQIRNRAIVAKLTYWINV